MSQDPPASLKGGDYHPHFTVKETKVGVGRQGKAQPSILLPEPSLPRQGSFHYTVQSVGAIKISLLFLLPSQVVQGRSTGWGFQAGSVERPKTASKAEVFLKHGTSHLSPSSELAVAPMPEGASPLFWYLWTSGPPPASWPTAPPSTSAPPGHPKQAVCSSLPTLSACAPHRTDLCSQDHSEVVVCVTPPGRSARYLSHR